MADELRDAPLVGPIIQMAPAMKSWQYGDILAWEEAWRDKIIQIENKEDPEMTITDLADIQEAIQKERDAFLEELIKVNNGTLSTELMINNSRLLGEYCENQE